MIPKPTIPALLAIVLILGAAVQAASCAARPNVTAGARAFLDCEDPAVRSAIGDVVFWAERVVLATIGGDGKPDAHGLWSALAPLKTDLGRCAFAAAVAALTVRLPQGVTEQAIAGAPLLDKDALRAAFVAQKTSLGWGPVKTNGLVF